MKEMEMRLQNMQNKTIELTLRDQKEETKLMDQWKHKQTLILKEEADRLREENRRLVILNDLLMRDKEMLGDMVGTMANSR